jgi:hypothetical protein
MSSLRTILQGIYENEGRLTPALVVDEARPVKSELHHCFEWDDTVAGERWRLEQAAELIRSVKVIRATKDDVAPGVRSWMVDREKPAPRSYEPVEDLLSDPLQRKLLLASFKRDWASFQARYQRLQEFATTIQASLAANKRKAARKRPAKKVA